MSRHTVVIGSGISGASIAWLLASAGQRVTLIEKNDYFGGHTCTETVSMVDQAHAVDMGFIVFNRPNYPNLSGLFDHLGIVTQPTTMSFSVSRDQGNHQYGGHNFSTFMAHKNSRWRWSHWKLLWEILRFNRAAMEWLNRPTAVVTLADWLKEQGFSQAFAEAYLLPMSAAIWSCPPQSMLDYPAKSLLQFFKNHGLLQLKGRPQWETVKGGSQVYLQQLLSHDNIRCVKANAELVGRSALGVIVGLDHGEQVAADALVLAAHADESLAFLGSFATQLEKRCLLAFRYQSNWAYLHSDVNFMPSERGVWSAWNFLANETSQPVQVTYWMNALQAIKSEQPLLVTLNPVTSPDPRLTWKVRQFHHPVFTPETQWAQLQLPALQGLQSTWFVGSYTGYGFHEDGIASSVKVARYMGVPIPWEKI